MERRCALAVSALVAIVINFRLNKPQRQRTRITCIAAIEVFIRYSKRSFKMTVATGTRHSLSHFGIGTFTAGINIARTRFLVAATSATSKLISQKLHRQRFASFIIIKKGSQSPLQYFARLLSLLEIKDLAQKLDKGSPTQTRVFRLKYPTMDGNVPLSGIVVAFIR